MIMHLPAAQVATDTLGNELHTNPHAPQFIGLVPVSMQLPPHNTLGAVHVQAPASLQTPPAQAPHVWPQPSGPHVRTRQSGTQASTEESSESAVTPSGRTG